MATRPAIVGSMRLGNARLGYNPTALAATRATRVRIYINGVVASVPTASPRVEMAGLSIRDIINESPSTCSFVALKAAPSVAQSLRITINSDTPRLLFNGAIQTVDTSYVTDKNSNRVYPCTAIDDLEKLKRRRPFGTFTSISATTVVQQLAASFAPGFTTTNVQASLPTVSIKLDGSEGWDGALKQIAGLIGGYYYIEDGDIHLFTAESTDLPDAVDASHPPDVAPAVAITTDLTQLRTRVYGKGYGTTVPTDVGVADTILPLDNATQFNPAGGKVIAETQRLNYTGIQAGGAGSLVGPGAQPSSAPFVVPVAGSGVTVGSHDWAYTWVTGAGETLPSPLATMVVGTATAPAVGPTALALGSNDRSFLLSVGDSVVYSYSWSTALSIADLTQESARSPTDTITVVANPLFGWVEAPIVYVNGSADPRVRWVRVWASVNGGPTQLVGLYPNGTMGYANPGNIIIFTVDGGSFIYTHSTATVERVSLSGVAVGPSGTTSRKLYRTVAGGAQLKLLATLADNTTTDVVDIVGDGSLGANAPTSDTSGLTQPTGQVNAGSTSLVTASAASFAATGGWALLGSQAVRYTGISGNTLTGIPASGAGALISSVRYGETVDPSPALTGVTGIATAIPRGTPVNIWVQRDNTAAQATQAALDGGDGIYEYLVSDERRNEVSLTALCDANLELFARPIITAKYATRDVKTKSGKPVTLTSILGYTGTLTIQDVSISEIDIAAATPPKFTVTASSVRVSLESVLRSLLGEAA
jgi:hypothetical protein